MQSLFFFYDIHDEVPSFDLGIGIKWFIRASFDGFSKMKFKVCADHCMKKSLIRPG